MHSLKVHRGDEVRDLLDLAKMDIYRFETDRDRLIYNGNLELSHLLPDIRVGDVIEYSYSIIGNNPALGSHFRGYAQHQYGVPVRFLRNRFTVAEETDVYIKSLAGAPAPERSVVPEGQVYDWTRRDVAGSDYESGQPEGAFVYPTSLLTTYASWSEVGQHFAQFYDTSGEKPEDLIKIAREIMAQHKSQTARTRAALSWIQSQVRYLGIELGAGGFIPRSPGLVIERRFGDCKDMVLLLNALLEVMGIEASPVLVHSDWRGDVDLWGPTHAAFDHVISMVSIGGMRYFLDPTRGEQLGDLNNVAVTEFGKGVVVGDDSGGMVDIKVAGPAFLNVFEDYYAPIGKSANINFRNVSTYFGSEADRMLDQLNGDGVEAIAERFLNYYRDYFEEIEQTAPMSVEVSEEEAKLVLTSQYVIKNAWTDSEDGAEALEFSISSGDLLSLVPDLPDGPRETAFAIKHPTRVKHSYEITLDDSWELEDYFSARRLASFDFRSVETFHRGILKNETTFYTRADRIEPGEFETAQEALDELHRFAGVTLWRHPESWPFLDEDTFVIALIVYAVLGLLLTFFIAYRRRNDDLEWRTQQIYYPVSVFKFVLLSVATYGFYQMYWAYKNWLWVKEAEGAKVMPLPRAFFAGITNFWLFTRIATHAPMRGKLLHVCLL